MPVDLRSPALHRPTRALRILLLAATLGVAGCSVAGALPASPAVPPAVPPAVSPTDPGSASIDHPLGRGDLVIRVELVGGFIGPSALVTRYPIVSIYGDGTAIAEGPVPMIYPGPALPNLQAAHVSEAGLQGLLGLAVADGLLGPDASYNGMGVADAATTAFTVVANGVRHRITAYALSEAANDAGLDAATAAARAGLRAFAAAVTDLRGTLGSSAVGGDTPYVYTGVALYVAPGAPASGDSTLVETPIAWPFAMSLATFGEPAVGSLGATRCGVVTGSDLDTLRPLLARANQLTGWTSAGATYTITPRLLLPDETRCPGAA